MTDKENREHIQYTHNAYCQIVIRHASIDAARILFAKWKREIFLEYLSEEKFMLFSTTDEYFAQPPINEDYPFTACGQIVLLSDPVLAAALSMLPQQKQEEIFLYYFRHCTQKAIGSQYGQTCSTAGRHIRLALQQLRQEMKVIIHEQAAKRWGILERQVQKLCGQNRIEGAAKFSYMWMI